MSEKLKPCPFCGEPVEFNKFAEKVVCEDCGATIYSDYWNTRPIEDALNARIAELEGKIDQLTAHDATERQDDKSPNDTQTQTIVYGKWIPVSERLPEVYRDGDGEFIPFLVCENDKDYPYRAIYDGLNWGDGMFVADVTHWMPLPESPNDTQTQTIVYGKEREE